MSPENKGNDPFVFKEGWNRDFSEGKSWLWIQARVIMKRFNSKDWWTVYWNKKYVGRIFEIPKESKWNKRWNMLVGEMNKENKTYEFRSRVIDFELGAWKFLTGHSDIE
jgi:hypothetical protein